MGHSKTNLNYPNPFRIDRLLIQTNITNNSGQSLKLILTNLFYPNRDIVLNDSEASWVSSLSSLGFVLGGLASGLFMRLLGRKYSSLLGLGGSYVIGYALIAFAPAKEYIYVGRFFGGICQVKFHF